MDQRLRRRRQSQPAGKATCGSVFRNPGDRSVGMLIESCGLKGFSVGGAQVSDVHSNFVINKGGASATDVVAVMIGNLQTNKINHVVGCVSLIHSISSAHLAEAVSKRSVARGVVSDVLLETNVSGEESKSGFSPAELVAEIDGILALPGIRVHGLMHSDLQRAEHRPFLCRWHPSETALSRPCQTRLARRTTASSAGEGAATVTSASRGWQRLAGVSRTRSDGRCARYPMPTDESTPSTEVSQARAMDEPSPAAVRAARTARRSSSEEGELG